MLIPTQPGLTTPEFIMACLAVASMTWLTASWFDWYRNRHDTTRPGWTLTAILTVVAIAGSWTWATQPIGHGYRIADNNQTSTISNAIEKTYGLRPVDDSSSLTPGRTITVIDSAGRVHLAQLIPTGDIRPEGLSVALVILATEAERTAESPANAGKRHSSSTIMVPEGTRPHPLVP